MEQSENSNQSGQETTLNVSPKPSSTDGSQVEESPDVWQNPCELKEKQERGELVGTPPKPEQVFKAGKKEDAMAKGKERVLGIQQQMMLAKYFDPNSETFGNAKESALAVGYANAGSVTNQQWFKEALAMSKKLLLNKAERNLDEILDMDCHIEFRDKLGRLVKDQMTGEVARVVHSGLLKIKADISKFVAAGVGKDDYGGGNVFIKIDI